MKGEQHLMGMAMRINAHDTKEVSVVFLDVQQQVLCLACQVSYAPARDRTQPPEVAITAPPSIAAMRGTGHGHPSLAGRLSKQG